MDERLDELLNDLPEPEGGDAEEINPWRRPMTYLAWGILLTTVTLNFLQLDRLLPPAGMVLLCLGLRPLRRENGGFRWAYRLAVLRLAILFAVPALRAAPGIGGGWTEALTAPLIFLQTAQLIFLRAGFREVFDRAGAARRLAGVNWLIAFNLFLGLGALLEIGSMGPLGLVVLAGYIAVIAAVARLPRSLGDAGCVLRNAPVRLSDAAFSVLTLGALLAVSATAWGLGLAASVPEAEPFAPEQLAGLPAELPAEIAELLTGEDAALLREAEDLQLQWSGDVQSMNRLTDLTLCTVTAELPEARLLIMQYFRWDRAGPVFGDGFTAWHSSWLTRVGTPRGAVFYERGGETFRSDLANLSWGSRTRYGFFTDTSPYIWADVYAPLGAENTRGYLIYTVSAGAEIWLNYNCQLNYYHRTLPDTLSQTGTPTDAMFSGEFDHRYQAIFDTLFTAWRDSEIDF